MANDPNKVPEVVQTTTQLQSELDRLILEEKQLDLELKRESVSKIRAQRSAKLEEYRTKIQATLQLIAQREAIQRNCNHRKGGTGAEAVMRGQGSSAYYAVIKHRKPNGRYMVLCQRCQKEWHPADPINGEKETPGWAQAIDMASDNTPSSSLSTFLFERTPVAV